MGTDIDGDCCAARDEEVFYRLDVLLSDRTLHTEADRMSERRSGAAERQYAACELLHHGLRVRFQKSGGFRAGACVARFGGLQPPGDVVGHDHEPTSG
jgi:hypothetical protein